MYSKNKEQLSRHTEKSSRAILSCKTFILSYLSIIGISSDKFERNTIFDISFNCLLVYMFSYILFIIFFNCVLLIITFSCFKKSLYDLHIIFLINNFITPLLSTSFSSYYISFESQLTTLLYIFLKYIDISN